MLSSGVVLGLCGSIVDDCGLALFCRPLAFFDSALPLVDFALTFVDSELLWFSRLLMNSSTDSASSRSIFSDTVGGRQYVDLVLSLSFV